MSLELSAFSPFLLFLTPYVHSRRLIWQMSIKLLLALLVSICQKPSHKGSRHRIQACQTHEGCEPKADLASITGNWEPLKSAPTW